MSKTVLIPFETLPFRHRSKALLPIYDVVNNRPWQAPSTTARSTASYLPPPELDIVGHDNVLRNAIYATTELIPLRGGLWLLSSSPAALQTIGASPSLSSSAIECLAGNTLPRDGSVPLSHHYCGYQFGAFSGQLGDGTAFSLGEVPLANQPDAFWDLALKGSGPNIFSRGNDGRKVLRSSIREYLASESMNALGIPTTRALSLITSTSIVNNGTGEDRGPTPSPSVRGESVIRDPSNGVLAAIYEPCAVVCRSASSFLRIGSFQTALGKSPVTDRMGPNRGHPEILHDLFHQLLSSQYPQLWQDFLGVEGTGKIPAKSIFSPVDMSDSGDMLDDSFVSEFIHKYTLKHDGQPQHHAGPSISSIASVTSSRVRNLHHAFLSSWGEKLGSLVAQWNSVGFAHGMLNTDNISAVGLTIDYGPFAFVERFHAEERSCATDTFGRYRLGKQRAVCEWNARQFARALALLPLPLSKTKSNAAGDITVDVKACAKESQARVEEYARHTTQAFHSGYEKTLRETWAAKLGIFTLSAREGENDKGDSQPPVSPLEQALEREFEELLHDLLGPLWTEAAYATVDSLEETLIESIVGGASPHVMDDSSHASSVASSRGPMKLGVLESTGARMHPVMRLISALPSPSLLAVHSEELFTTLCDGVKNSTRMSEDILLSSHLLRSLKRLEEGPNAVSNSPSLTFEEQDTRVATFLSCVVDEISSHCETFAEAKERVDKLRPTYPKVRLARTLKQLRDEKDIVTALHPDFQQYAKDPLLLVSHDYLIYSAHEAVLDAVTSAVGKDSETPKTQRTKVEAENDNAPMNSQQITDLVRRINNDTETSVMVGQYYINVLRSDVEQFQAFEDAKKTRTARTLRGLTSKASVAAMSTTISSSTVELEAAKKRQDQEMWKKWLGKYLHVLTLQEQVIEEKRRFLSSSLVRELALRVNASEASESAENMNRQNPVFEAILRLRQIDSMDSNHPFNNAFSTFMRNTVDETLQTRSSLASSVPSSTISFLTQIHVLKNAVGGASSPRYMLYNWVAQEIINHVSSRVKELDSVQGDEKRKAAGFGDTTYFSSQPILHQIDVKLQALLHVLEDPYDLKRAAFMKTNENEKEKDEDEEHKQSLAVEMAKWRRFILSETPAWAKTLVITCSS